MYDTLIISAWGTKLFNFLGAVKYLDECNLLKNIKEYYGCSGGWIICWLLSINYSINEIIWCLTIWQIQTFYNKLSFNFFINNIAMYNNYNISKFLIKMIYEKTQNGNITLIEIKNIYNKKINLSTFNIDENKIIYLNYLNNPNLPLWKAILMWISVPIMFPPVFHENNYYIDGAILESIPLFLTKKKINKWIILTYWLDKKINFSNKKNLFFFIKYFSYIFSILNKYNNELCKQMYFDNAIFLDCNNNEINFFDLELFKGNFKDSFIIDKINKSYNECINKNIKYKFFIKIYEKKYNEL